MNMKAKIMQAISAIVRNHELAEQVFCKLDQAQAIFDEGDATRSQLFESAISVLAENFLGESKPLDLRVAAVELLEQLWEQKRVPVTLVERKQALVAFGVQRISSLRSLEGEEKEYAAAELERWESFLILLARS